MLWWWGFIIIIVIIIIFIMIGQTWDVEGFDELFAVYCVDDSLLSLEKDDRYIYCTACTVHATESVNI